MTNKRRIHDHGMSADRPIEIEKDDILDRGDFAKQLACDIKAWDASESLVIGLYGGWGSGKTSLKNLILRELNKSKNPLSVMQFNPWRFSGKATINEAFFSDLRHALRPKDFDDVKGVRRAIKLNLWSKAMSSLAVPVQIAGGIFAAKQPEIGASIVGVGAGLKQAAKVAKEGAEATKAEAEYAKLSTEELKQSIAESLKELEKPLLVVIDDIDRLSSNEILEIFQLVKSNADFPKIIYLLLCEQVVVTQALDKVSNDRGTEYLEKIVQVSFQVPHPSKETIFKILTHKMSFYIQKAHAEARWDLDRWQTVFRDGLDAYFTNLRHVYRFLGSYYFHLRHFRREAKSEVNPIDLATLEVLRLNEPRIYEKLPYSKTLLTRDFGRNLFRKSTQTIVDAAIQQILLGTTVDGREHVKDILQEVFPAITERYDGKGGITQSLGTWLGEARVCHPELFDKYFTLVVKENELSQVELDLLVENAADRKAFILQCEALKARSLLSVALKRLEAVKESVPMSSIPSLCKALFDIADDLPEESIGLDRIRSFDACWQIVYTGLQREKKPSVRFQIMRDAILDSEGLALSVDIVRWQNRKGGSQSHPREYLVEEKDFVALSQICLKKIRAAVSSGKLRHNVRVREISWALEEWAPKELLKWYRKLCRNSTTIPFFLTMMLSRSASSQDVHYYIRLKDLARYVDVARLERKLASLNEDAFSEIEKEALRAFHRAVKRKKAGKPEPDGRNIFDEEDQS